MQKRLWRWFPALLLVLAGGAFGQDGAQTKGGPGGVDVDETGAVGTEATFQAVMELLVQRHVDSEVSREALYEAAIEGMLEYAFTDIAEGGAGRGKPSDRSPYLLSPARRAMSAELARGRFTGVGCMVGEDPSTGWIQVLEVLPDSPAARAGLQVGDRVLAIDGVPLRSSVWPRGTAADRAAGQTRVFRIQRGGEEQVLRIVPETLTLPGADAEWLPGRIGLVRVRFVGAGTAVRVHGLLDELKDRGARAVILDLRDTWGSDLEAAVQVLDFLVPAGDEVLRLADRGGHVERFVSRGSDTFGFSWAVLISERTGLAAEVIARALERSRGALLVGVATRGRSLVAEDVAVAGGYAVRVPVRRIVPPEGPPGASLVLEPDVVAGVSQEDVLRAYQASNPDTRLSLDPGFRAALERLVGQVQESTPYPTEETHVEQP